LLEDEDEELAFDAGLHSGIRARFVVAQVQERAWKIGPRRVSRKSVRAIERRFIARDKSSGKRLAAARDCSLDRFAIESTGGSMLAEFRFGRNRETGLSRRGSLREHFALEASGRARAARLSLHYGYFRPKY